MVLHANRDLVEFVAGRHEHLRPRCVFRGVRQESLEDLGDLVGPSERPRRAFGLEVNGLAGGSMERDCRTQGGRNVERFDVARARRLIDQSSQASDLCDQRSSEGGLRGEGLRREIPVRRVRYRRNPGSHSALDGNDRRAHLVQPIGEGLFHSLTVRNLAFPFDLFSKRPGPVVDRSPDQTTECADTRESARAQFERAVGELGGGSVVDAEGHQVRKPERDRERDQPRGFDVSTRADLADGRECRDEEPGGARAREGNVGPNAALVHREDHCEGQRGSGGGHHDGARHPDRGVDFGPGDGAQNQDAGEHGDREVHGERVSARQGFEHESPGADREQRPSGPPVAGDAVEAPTQHRSHPSEEGQGRADHGELVERDGRDIQAEVGADQEPRGSEEDEDCRR